MAKLIVAVIQARDADPALEALREARIGVTQMGSTGGFLRQGNVSLLIGVDNSRVDHALAILREHCQQHTEVQAVPGPARAGLPLSAGPMEVDVGGAAVFVLNLHNRSAMKGDAGLMEQINERPTEGGERARAKAENA